MKKMLFIFTILSITSGEMIFNSDGSTGTKIGNTYFHSDGSTSTSIGDTIFHSNGSSSIIMR